jgi:hypothetical protein
MNNIGIVVMVWKDYVSVCAVGYSVSFTRRWPELKVINDLLHVRCGSIYMVYRYNDSLSDIMTLDEDSDGKIELTEKNVSLEWMSIKCVNDLSVFFHA